MKCSCGVFMANYHLPHLPVYCSLLTSKIAKPLAMEIKLIITFRNAHIYIFALGT